MANQSDCSQVADRHMNTVLLHSIPSIEGTQCVGSVSCKRDTCSCGSTMRQANLGMCSFHRCCQVLLVTSWLVVEPMIPVNDAVHGTSQFGTSTSNVLNSEPADLYNLASRLIIHAIAKNVVCC